MQARACAQAIERVFATPKTAPNLFSRSMGVYLRKSLGDYWLISFIWPRSSAARAFVMRSKHEERIKGRIEPPSKNEASYSQLSSRYLSQAVSAAFNFSRWPSLSASSDARRL